MVVRDDREKGSRMLSKKLLILILCVLFTACSTEGYYADGMSSIQGDSTTKMGVRYLLGRGGKQSDEKAFYYFNRAAREDDPFAQNELAYLYAAGKGTARDNTKAFYWYQKAAAHGLASAAYNLSLMYLHGLGTAPNKTLSMMWLRKAAASGFEPAKQALAAQQ